MEFIIESVHFNKADNYVGFYVLIILWSHAMPYWRDLDHDGRRSTNDENVRKLSRVSLLQSDYIICRCSHLTVLSMTETSLYSTVR